MNTRPAELLDRGRQHLSDRRRRLRLECLEDRRVLSIQPFPVPLVAVEPLGSLIYQGSVRAGIAAGGETDSFTIDLDDGQTVTVVVAPEATLQPTIALLDPGDAVIGTAASVSPGEEAVLQAVATTGPGQYTITVGAVSDTTGSYTTRLILGAAVEAEQHGGPDNDQMASAEDLAASFIPLPGATADRGAVSGSLAAEAGDPPAVDELIVNGGFETGDFAGWTTSTSGRGELTPWTVAPAGGGFFFNSSPYAGTFSAYNGFDGEAGLQYELYQTVTISDFAAATLTTHHRIFYTGVAVDPQDRTLRISVRSALGGELETLYTELLTPASGPETDLGWRELSFDVGRYAGQTVQIHFLELIPETHTGPALIEFDEISLAVTQPDVDWYRFALHDCQSATLALDVPAADSLMLDLYDAAGTRLATGVPADNVVLALGNFVDGTSDGGPDTYYVRVAGVSAEDYRLVVTRDADFEIDADHGPTQAQSIMPSGVLLGHSRSVCNGRQQKLTDTDPAREDRFGWSVAISGDTAMVGAYGDDETRANSGSVSIFRNDGVHWVATQKLTNSDTAEQPYFGSSIAIDGDTAIVTAYSPVHTFPGSAYILRFDGSQWVEQQKLDTSGPGLSVAIDGDTAVVGIPSNVFFPYGWVHIFHFDGAEWVRQQTFAVGSQFGYSVATDGGTVIVGNPAANRAHVYRYDGSQWSQSQVLDSPAEQFGCSVAIDGDTAIVGAYEDSPGGAAYVFRFDGTQWVQQQKLVASDAGGSDRFGYSVSLSGHAALVGAYYDGDAGYRSGSAYVFGLLGNEWVELKKLTAADADDGDRFGRCVSLSGSAAIIGAYQETATSGAAYVFALSLDLADDYSVNVQAGDRLTVTTATPGGGPGQFLNELDPAIELYDPTGTLVADDDNGAADGRNAALTHDAALTGTYTARMVPVGDAQGEFLLSIAGHQGAPPAFQVRRTDPPDGARLLSATQITVDFNDTILLSSLEAADLAIDGVPAAEVYVLDGHTAGFVLAQVPAEGLHQVAIAAGAVVDLQGTPIEPFAGTLTIDTIPPRVTVSSPEEGETVPVGALVYAARFDEPLDAHYLDPSDVELVDQLGRTYVPLGLDYDPVDSILTLRFADLPESAYTLTLRSGDERFADVAGNQLDGGPSFPLPSGDGVSGDDFVLHFVVHDSEVVPPLGLQAAGPSGSLIYQGSVEGLIPSSQHPDRIPLDLDAVQPVGGQTVTVVVEPDSTLCPTIELLDPSGVTIGTAAAGSAGAEAVLQAAPCNGPGTYTVVMGGATDTLGTYTAQVILNAAVEGEAHLGPANNIPMSAEDLDGSFIRLAGGTAQRGAVLGTLADSNDWYSFTLGDGQSATLALTGPAGDDVSLELHNRTISLLATGTLAANVDRVVNNFLDTTSDGAADRYYVRVDGSVSADYRLLITRDADFDTEPNGPNRPQDVPPARVVLGHASAYRQQKLTASDGAMRDYFGRSVAIDGNTAIVGAFEDDDAREDSGSAYVYHFDGVRWIEQQKLTASDAHITRHFGYSVAIDGDTAIVGAYRSTYAFRFDGVRWIEQQKLTASDAAGEEYFGCSVSIDGDTAIVGAYGDDHAGTLSGSAYVFRFDGIRWIEQQKLTASDAASQDRFGCSLSIDGDTAVVAAYADADAGFGSGSAYVYHFDGEQWGEQQKLTASDAEEYDFFGYSLSIDGDTVIVGAYNNDDAGESSGSVYIFDFNGGQWVQQQKLTASHAAAGAYFGWSVSIDGNAAIVGAYGNDDAGSTSGTAYLFHFEGGQWVQQQKLAGSDTGYGDNFGYSVSIDGHTAIVGARSDNVSGGDSGSAYVFAADSDDFAVSVQAGKTLVVETATPGDGPGEFVNELDPAVQLYDPAGTLVADDDNGAADGRNARIAYSAPVDGTYTVRVLASGAGSSGEYVLSLLQQSHAAVAGRHVFYNDSAFDGNDPAANPGDDQAIAVDKQALLPGRTATFANYTGYSRGINGVMVDVAGLTGTPTVADFAFKVGNDDEPAGWADAPAPSSITARPGQGVGGSHRLTIIWPHNVIQKQWLQITVLPTENTGLVEPDVFYFGNAVGETGNSTTDAKVNSFDMLAARDNQRGFLDPAPIDFDFDFNRDARVGAVDMLIARNNTTHFLNALRLITVPGDKPAAERLDVDGVPLHDVLWPQNLVQETAWGARNWWYEYDPIGVETRRNDNVPAAESLLSRIGGDRVIPATA